MNTHERVDSSKYCNNMSILMVKCGSILPSVGLLSPTWAIIRELTSLLQIKNEESEDSLCVDLGGTMGLKATIILL